MEPCSLTKAQVRTFKEHLLRQYRHLSKKELQKLARAYELLAGKYAHANHRKFTPGSMKQPYFWHIHRVMMMPAKYGIQPYVTSLVATIVGFGSHDLGEEVFPTIDSALTWIADSFGEEAAAIAAHLHIPGKNKGIKTTPAMREQYYEQIDNCPNCIEKRYPEFLNRADHQRIKIVAATGIIFDHLDAALSINCLEPEAQIRKVASIRKHCYRWLEELLAPYYQKQVIKIRSEFERAFSIHKVGL